jgi:integrase/recombinase XerD
MAKRQAMKLSPTIHQFFNQYLPHIKGVSEHTLKAYRDAFKLFLIFAADYYRIKIKSLRLEQITSELILAFLDDLQAQRHNRARTRNYRLAALKSFAKMIRLLYPQHREVAEAIFSVPLKRTQKTLVGFLYPEEILSIFHTVNLKRKEGSRDYALLHLLFDSGARASEVATLNLNYFNPEQKTLAILGKGNRFRLIELEPKTTQLLQLYIARFRPSPKPPYQHRLFVNQRGEELTRFGIYRLCKKYLAMALPPKRLKSINPVHSSPHSCAVNMIARGLSASDVKNRLGHDNLQSTMTYLHLDLNIRRQIQKRYINHMQSLITLDPKVEELLQWESDKDMIAWLDNL